jgi:gas vesicle protein
MGKTFGKVVIAGIAGAIAGLLFSPKSGKENRDDIKKKADELKKQAEKKAIEAKHTGKKGKKEFDGLVDRASDELNEFKQTAKQSAEKVGAELKKVGLDAKRRGEDIAKDAKTSAQNVKNDPKR